MRVISQDGTLDIPYEMVVIQRFEEKIYFLNQNLAGVEGVTSDLEIAGYSTEEKAIRAMQMLRKTYIGRPITIYPSKMVFTNNVIIFQFPQDDEIEV